MSSRSPVERILAQYASTRADQTLTAADGMRARIRRQEGVSNFTPAMERDFATLTPGQLYVRYGSAAPNMIGALADGSAQYNRDSSATRSTGQMIGDLALDAWSGFSNLVGGITSLGAGFAVDPILGTSFGQDLARGTQEASDFYRSRQSDGLNRRRNITQLRGEVNYEENARRHTREVENGSSSFAAGLRRFGRDAVDAVSASLSDGMVFGSDLVNSGVSMFAVGPLARGIAAFGRAGNNAAASIAARVGMSPEAMIAAGAATNRVAQAARHAPTMGAIGLMEGGGAYVDASNQIMAMSHDDLLSGSDEYRSLIEQGVNPENAKEQVAAMAARAAGASQFTIGAASGRLVAPLESNLFRGMMRSNVVSSAAREAVEESIQGASSAGAVNRALEQYADPDVDMMAGVGAGAGTGALHGAASAGGIAAPGAVARTTMRGATAAIGKAKQAGTAVYDAIADRYHRIQEENRKSSPVSDENVGAEVQAAAQSAPEAETALREAIDQTDAAPEEKQKAHTYVDDLLAAVTFDETELQNPEMPEQVRTTLAGSANRFEAIRRLTDVVDKTEDGSEEQLSAAFYLYDMLTRNSDVVERKLATALDNIPEGDPARAALDSFSGAIAGVGQNPRVINALARIEQLSATAAQSVKTETIDQVDTPEARQAIQTTIKTAEISPLDANPEAITKVLYHADQGKLDLAPAQRVSLRAAKMLIEAQKDYLDKIQELKLSDNNNVVSEQIISHESGKKALYPSAADYVREIVAAARAGEQDLVATHLHRLTLFAKHMQNKVAALNEHHKTGNGNKTQAVKFQALVPGQNKFALTTKGVYVNRFAAPTVKNAQEVANDAAVLGRVANEMVAAFPELGIKTVDLVELDHELSFGTASEVVRAHKEGRVPSKTVETQSDEASVEQENVGLDPEESSTQEEVDATPEPAETGQPEGGDKSAATEDATETETVEAAPVEEAAEEITEEPVAKIEPEAPISETETSEAVDEVEQPKQGLDTVLPNIPEWSLLRKAFRLPNKPKTRILEVDSPIEAIRQALSSNEALASFLGSSKKSLSDDAVKQYREFLGIADNIKAYMELQLQEALAKKRGGQTIADILKQDLTVDGENPYGRSRLLRFANFKVLNLVEERDGELAYNEKLLEASILASLQWLLATDRYKSRLDEDDVSRITGIDTPSPALIKALNNGLSLVEAKRSLAAKIKSYWGLSEAGGAALGQVEGLPEAMAAELLHALVSNNALANNEPIELTEADGLPPREDGKPAKKTFHSFVPVTKKLDPEDRKHWLQDPEAAIYSFPDAIDQAVLLEQEGITYSIGEQISTAITPTQLRNREVELTAQQKQAIAFERKQPHFVNLPFVNMMKAIGEAGVLRLFAAGDLNGRKMNEQDRKSKDGTNRTFLSSYASLMQLMTEARHQAETSKTDVDQLPIYYDYTFTRVNRMQMLGLNNPQASKLMREAVLPTRATIDLTNEDVFSVFGLALAQALGIKVHQKSREDGVSEILGKLEGDLAGSVKVMQEWLANQDRELSKDELDTIASEMGEGMAPVALHAVTEYARYKNADEAGRKAFTTSLYVEADGVTNGPVNAMALLSVGRFTPEWLENIRKGGLFPGSNDETMNSYRQKPGTEDLYQTVTNLLGDNMVYNPEVSGPINAQLGKLLKIMDTFLPDVNFDGKNLTFDRGVAKNPLTITIYGSGARGIANKVAGQVVDAIYERLSDGLQAAESKGKTLAEGMFPGYEKEDAEAKLNEFFEIFNSLTTQVVEKGFKGLEFKPGLPVKQETRSPDKFALSVNELKNLQQNMLALFVDPLRGAIEETVGESLIGKTGSAVALRQAIQVQSIFLEHAFKRAVATKLEEKAKDPEWTKEDFLTREELSEIFRELKELAPFVETDAQRYFIAGSNSAAFEDLHFGNSLQDQMRTDAEIQTVADAGVAGIPAMVIGSGDGMMMQILSTMQGALERTLKIFDGMNMPLDLVQEGSQKANQAVFESWQGNPLQAVADAYTGFLESMSVDEMSDEQARALGKAFGFWEKGKANRGQRLTSETTQVLARELGDRINRMALEAEARHRALARVNLTVDQMAAAGAAYQHKGEISLEGMNDEQILKVLNELAVEEYKKLVAEKSETKVEEKPTEPAKTDPQLDGIGRLLKNGAREVSFTALRKLGRAMNMAPEQRSLLNEVLRALSTKEYKLVFGNAEQVQAYAEERGKTLPLGFENEKNKGFIVLADKTIYVMDPTAETVLHELVHAASFDAVQAFYDGSELGPNSVEQVRAIRRLEGLVAQFRQLDVSNEDVATQEAYLDAIEAIEAYQRQGNKAAALNEFMAWGLSNARLAELQKKTAANPLVQLARDIVAMIKRLIWGRKQGVELAAQDMLSNLRFNAGIVMQSKVGARELYRQTALFQHSTYGTSDRLTRINVTLGQKIVRHLDRKLSKVPDQETRDRMMKDQLKKLASSSDLALNVMSLGFPMSAQERSTFTTLVSTLATTVTLDPNALARVEQLYRHVVKTLTVEDFMARPDDNDMVDRHYAHQKYDVVIGNYRVDMDAQQRSSLMPVFLALAMVNDQFRSILSKMPLPKAEKGSDKTVDTMLENLTNSAMDQLSARISGEGAKAPNVQAAMDALMGRILETAEDRQSFAERIVAPIGRIVGTANDLGVKGIQKLAELGSEKAEDLKASDNRGVQLLGQALKGISGIADQRIGGEVSEGILASLDRNDVRKSLREFLADIVGRTDSNAPVFDMIKQVRNWVQQRRQQFREHLPSVIRSKFSRKLTEEEWTSLYTVLGRTDAAVLLGRFSKKEVLDLLNSETELAAAIERLEGDLQNLSARDWKLIQLKARQLAHFMNTGETGNSLLRNAKAVANLLGEGVRYNNGSQDEASRDLVKVVDNLVTLYAIEGLPKAPKDIVSSLAQDEAEGISFLGDYLVGQRASELKKIAGTAAELNHYKGHVPVENQPGLSLIVADDSEHEKLLKMSFVRIAPYKGSNLDGRAKRSYYFAPVSGRATYHQGILQNVRTTAYGVDVATGFTHDLTAGRIEDPRMVQRIYQNAHREQANEPLMPVWDAAGSIVAYERSIDPKRLELLNRETDLAKLVGVWRGRQLEEEEALIVNELLVERLHKMWEDDINEDAGKQNQYVDLRDRKALEADPVLADAVQLITPATWANIESLFGKHFYVRRTLVNDAVGYRAPSIGDLWTGNSRWSDGKMKTIREALFTVFGNKAYKIMLNGERIVQNLVTDARVLIVVKSVIVPAVNMISNVYQLMARGVSVVDIGRGMPRKVAEVNAYLKSRLRLDEVEAELRAATEDPIATRRLQAEMQSIQDGHRRLSIWPLIEAGEFSSISDGTITHDDLNLTEGRLSEYIEKKIDQLPPSVRDIGRYGFISRDTALFQGLQRAVEYGDFLGKAILFDHLTEKKDLSVKDALARITEEFVNYDRLPGRTRGYLESMGLLWFWNFKIRSTKVALSMIRNNPIHTLLAMGAPTPTMFGIVGLPVEDNLFSVAADGRLDYSMGFGMGFRSAELFPWANAIS